MVVVDVGNGFEIAREDLKEEGKIVGRRGEKDVNVLGMLAGRGPGQRMVVTSWGTILELIFGLSVRQWDIRRRHLAFVNSGGRAWRSAGI